jgi:hypothetical protein
MAGSVGFVGLGNMGGPMALNLVKANDTRGGEIGRFCWRISGA